jgi:phosphatidylserine/phosphatidylglycerophosphate/cardiolipin synthase-like enzyme
MATNDLGVKFLRDTTHGGAASQPKDIAKMLAEFVTAATASLDIAIYDFKLSDPLASTVADAFKQAAAKGVEIRIGYDADKPVEQTIAAFEAVGGDPAPPGTEEWLKEHLGGVSGIALKRIVAPGDSLMHSKYIVRDVANDTAAVWMGSANFTDGAWTRQENNILCFNSPALAQAYERDFEEMWQHGAIKGAGKGDVGDVAVDGVDVAWEFSPGEGKAIDKHLTAVIEAAKSKLRVSSMVLTSPAVLAALAAAIERGVEVDGIYDGGEMKGVEKEWESYAAKGSPTSSKSLATFREVAKHLVAKQSSGYSPTGPHDFMHNKALVKDEQLVVTGSYNFSANAEGNAENQLTIADPTLAKAYADYIAKLIAEYEKGS